LAKKNARSIFVTDTTLEENSMTAEYKIIGDVAVITMSNPPVNGLGLSTRVGSPMV